MTYMYLFLCLIQMLVAHNWTFNFAPYIPEAMNTDEFINKVLRSTIKPFSLHPDFVMTPQDISQMEYAKDTWTEFRSFEINKFIKNTNNSAITIGNHAIYVIENKLRLIRYINQFNSRYPQNPIKMMKTWFIIYENSEHNDVLHSIVNVINNASYLVMKPSYSSQSVGYKLWNVDENDHTVQDIQNEIFQIFNNSHSETEGTPKPLPQDRAIMFQEYYMYPTEVKLWILFGKFYYAMVADWPGGAVFTFTKDIIGRNPWRQHNWEYILSMHDVDFDYIVSKSEQLAQNIGCYHLRVDWFVGGRWGTVLNELAFPNYMHSDATEYLPMRDIIYNVFKNRTGILTVRESRHMFLDRNTSEIQPLDFSWPTHKDVTLFDV